MTVPRSGLTRRRLFEVTAAATAGLWLPQVLGHAAEPAAAEPECASNEHFWYRLQPAGPYIDSQRDNKAFGYTEDAVLLSEDNGRSWPHRFPFAEAKQITFSSILRNGNVLFATATKLYVSTDSLKTVEPVMVKDAQGADYLPHTPANPQHPGWYFNTLCGVVSWEVNGREMLVWGNYCNVQGGAAPVNIYYSTDQGRTVKLAYAFGQHPRFRDNGSPGGGKTGTLLGNPDNPLLCRHVHAVAYNPAEDAFYACTGDIDRGAGPECHWLRGTYDAAQDAWQWKVLVSVPSNSRLKSGGITFIDGKLYWVSDSNGPKPYDRGIFCCDPADIADLSKHTRLLGLEVESANMIIQDGVILASHYAPASPLATGIVVSLDMGQTWAQYDLAEFGRRSPTRFQEKNRDGWFRVDLRRGWIDKGEVLFIKPKQP